MSDGRDDPGRDNIEAYDNYTELVADTSIQQLTVDFDRTPPPPPPATAAAAAATAAATSSPADDDVWRCRRIWRHVYWLLSSGVCLVCLLVVYTLVGAAVLNHTERHHELHMHAQLDAVRRRVVADILNVTAARRSRDDGVKSRDPRDVGLADAVDELLVEYGDARQSLNPGLKPPAWTFSGALFFCTTVYTTIGQFQRATGR